MLFCQQGFKLRPLYYMKQLFLRKGFKSSRVWEKFVGIRVLRSFLIKLLVACRCDVGWQAVPCWRRFELPIECLPFRLDTLLCNENRRHGKHLCEGNILAGTAPTVPLACALTDLPPVTVLRTYFTSTVSAN